MPTVDIEFDKGTVVPYFVGAPSCAVPGTIAGLSEAHRVHGRLPWRELFPPAIEAARDGVPIGEAHARLHVILDPILRLDEEGRRIYGHERPLEARRGADDGRPGGHARAARARGRRRVLPRRPVQGHAPLRRRGRRRAHGQGPRLVPAAALEADPCRVPGHGVRHLSAALGGRRADRVRAADPRPARPARGSRLGRADRPPRRGDAGNDPCARRLVHRRAPRRRTDRAAARRPDRRRRRGARAPARRGRDRIARPSVHDPRRASSTTRATPRRSRPRPGRARASSSPAPGST